MYKTSLALYYGSFLGYISIVIYVFIKAVLKKKPITNDYNLKYVITIFAIIAVWGAFTGDYPHYKEIVNNIHTRVRFLTHFEDIYIWIVDYVNGDYTLFRIFISSISFISLYWIFKLSACLDYRIVFLYSALEFMAAIEGRQQCCIYIFYLGIIICLEEKKRLLGLIFIIASSFFHKSFVINILLLPFLFIKINRKNILLLLIAFPFIVYLENMIVDRLMIDKTVSAMKSINYLSNEDFSRTFAMEILYKTTLLTLYGIGFITLRKYYIRRKNLYIKKDLLLVHFARLLFGAVYISSLIYFLDINQSTPFARSIRLWFIPLLIVMSRQLRPRLLTNKLIVSLSLCYLLLQLLYTYMIYRYQATEYFS